MYKEGRGVTKDMTKAMRLMQQASVAGNLEAMVEFAIAQFNGEGTPKDETAAAPIVRESGASWQPDSAKSPCTDSHGRSWPARGSQQKP